MIKVMLKYFIKYSIKYLPYLTSQKVMQVYVQHIISKYNEK